MENRLKDCPFCGLPEPELLEVARHDDLWFRVICRRCDAGTASHFLAKDAEAVWNTRALAPSEKVREANEVLASYAFRCLSALQTRSNCPKDCSLCCSLQAEGEKLFPKMPDDTSHKITPASAEKIRAALSRKLPADNMDKAREAVIEEAGKLQDLWIQTKVGLGPLELNLHQALGRFYALSSDVGRATGEKRGECEKNGCVDGNRLDYNPRSGQGKECACPSCAPPASKAEPIEFGAGPWDWIREKLSVEDFQRLSYQAGTRVIFARQEKQ